MKILNRTPIPAEWRGLIQAAYVAPDGSQNAFLAMREVPGFVSKIVEVWLVSGDAKLGPFDYVSDVHVPLHPRKTCAYMHVGKKQFITWGEKRFGPLGDLDEVGFGSVRIEHLVAGPSGPCFVLSKIYGENPHVFDGARGHGPYDWVDFFSLTDDGTACYIAGIGDSVSVCKGDEIISKFQETDPRAMIQWLGGKPSAFVGEGYVTYHIQPGGNLIAIGRKGPEGKYIQIGNERRSVPVDFKNLQWRRDGKSLMWAEQDATGGWSVYDGMSVVASFDSTLEWFEETGNGSIVAKIQIGGKNAIRCSDGTILWLPDPSSEGNHFKFRPPYGVASVTYDPQTRKFFLWLRDQLISREAYPSPSSFDVASSGTEIAFTTVDPMTLVAFGKKVVSDVADVLFAKDGSCVAFSQSTYHGKRTQLLFPDGTLRIGSVNGAAVIYVDGDDLVTCVAE